MVNDPQSIKDGLKRQRRLLCESDDVHEADREPIRRWIRKEDGSVALGTLETYLRVVRSASERAPTALVEMDGEDDFYNLVYALRHEHDLAESTIETYEDASLIFLDDMTDADWIDDVERTRADTNSPDRDQMLEPAEINELTSAAHHQRDVAFIEFLADTGARLSMALSLRVGDLDLGEQVTYTPNRNAVGLKGAAIQRYPLIDSAAAIKSYLRTSHPRPKNSDAALFHKIQPTALGDGGERWTDQGGITANTAQTQLKRITDRTDIDKPTNPHAFRHAAITRMAREGYSRSQIEHRVHWTLDSSMWETYEHISGQEHNEDIFREAGLLDPDDGPDRVRKNCGNCQESLAPHHDWCPNCGEPAAPGAADELADAKDTVLEELVQQTNPTTRRELHALLDEIDDRPDTARGDDHEDPS